MIFYTTYRDAFRGRENDYSGFKAVIRRCRPDEALGIPFWHISAIKAPQNSHLDTAVVRVPKWATVAPLVRTFFLAKVLQ